MKKLWIYLDEKNLPAVNKYHLAFILYGSLSALFGFLLWSVLRIWMFSTLDWMICFIGYPVVISFVIVFICGCNNEFHNGTTKRI